MTIGLAIGFGVPILIALAAIYLLRGVRRAALPRAFLIASVPSMLAAAFFLIFAGDNGHDFYAKNLRASLFSGFLGLGGFLLSLKTFIVVKMKEGLYDHAIYRERDEAERVAHPTLKFGLFDSLGRLRSLLFWAIVTAIFTAVTQVTIGLLAYDLAVVVALGFAGLSLGFLIQALFQINANLQLWFELLEEDATAKREHQKEQKLLAAGALEVARAAPYAE